DRAPAHAGGVVIIGEGKMVAGVEPAVVGVAQTVEFADVDHGPEMASRAKASSINDVPISKHHADVRSALIGIQRADRSAMGQRDLAGEAEADPAAALVGRIEGQENVLAAVNGDARTIVTDLD